ncbi:MAG: DUF3078 domain-containing protein [Rikenellaceae bacterium]|jgi:hypothetical protein|nr:DUF3078 domain-containing protein [Rikenellaceae bacterium]
MISVAVCLVCVCTSRAQFSIPTAESATLEQAPIIDTAIANPQINNPYFSQARWLAEKKALCKERNTIEFNANLAATQTQFKDWQAGGDNTFSARSSLYFRHQYKREKFSLDYRLDARYGANYIEKKLFKNEDEWKTNFQTAWTMHRNWSYAMTVNMRSQFSKGEKSRTDTTKISNFMAPGFLDVAIGFNWKRDSSPWNITISPIAGSVIFVLDEQLQARGINGVPKGNSTKGQLGPSLRVYYDKEFAKKVFRYRSDLYSFTNIRNAPTMRWENTLEIKATKLLSTKLYWLMYYDKQSIDKMQYNYSLSIGISYWIKNK